MDNNDFSFKGFFHFVRRVIEEAPVQIILSAILIILILGLFHGFISLTLGELDIGAFGWMALPLFIEITGGLLLFYIFVYPILRCYILSIGQEYLTHNKIPTLKSYSNRFQEKAGKLILFSSIRFGYQTFTLGLIFFFSVTLINFSNLVIYIILYLSFCYISIIPAIYGYKTLLFSELMVFNEGSFDDIIKTGKEISKKHNKTILLLKGSTLAINFVLLLTLALFTEKQSFYQYFSLPSIIWPSISLVFNWDILYTAIFILINTTFLIIETLFIPYAYKHWV